MVLRGESRSIVRDFGGREDELAYSESRGVERVGQRGVSRMNSRYGVEPTAT